MIEHDVDQLTDVGGGPAFIQAVISGGEFIQNRLDAGFVILFCEFHHRENKTFTLKLAADTDIIIAILFLVLFIVVLPYIGNIFHKQHHEDVVFVLRRINNAPEGVTRRPCRVVDVFLINLTAHDLFSFCKLHEYS